MVADPAIDALWLCGPNHARIENVEEIVDAIARGKGELVGIACEKPLARNVAEAKEVTEAGQEAPGCCTAISRTSSSHRRWSTAAPSSGPAARRRTGRPYLARAAEEHSGPHMPWFWQGRLQGGGVLNDMMCHSAVVVRHLLTEPGKPARSVRPVRVTGHIASLKWSRPEYVRRLKAAMGKEVDYRKHPAEDFASVMIEFETDDGHTVLGEATHQLELRRRRPPALGRAAGARVLDDVEHPRQRAQALLQPRGEGEVGRGPGREAERGDGADAGGGGRGGAYGYEAENRVMSYGCSGTRMPWLNWDDGLEVVRVLMAAYMSAEQGKTVISAARPRQLRAGSGEGNVEAAGKRGSGEVNSSC